MSRVAISNPAAGTGVFTFVPPATNTDRTLTLPDVAGDVIVGQTPTASTDNVVEVKIPVEIEGTVYYILATTSPT